MEPICVICFDNFKPTEKLWITPCSHVGHKSCMEIWFRNSLSCPHCRKCLKNVRPVYLNFKNSENSLQKKSRRLLEASTEKIAILEEQLEKKNRLIDNQIIIMNEKDMAMKKHIQKSKKLDSEIRKLRAIEATCTELKKSAAELSKQLEEERAKNRQMEISAATAKVKQNQKLGENWVKPKVEKIESVAKNKTRTPRVPLGAIDRNSEQNHGYNLRPR